MIPKYLGIADVRRVTMGVTVKKDPTFVLWPITVRMVELAMWKVARQNAVVSNVSAHILIHIVYTLTMVYIVYIHLSHVFTARLHNVSTHILIHIVYTLTMVYIVYIHLSHVYHSKAAQRKYTYLDTYSVHFNNGVYCVHTFEPCLSQQGCTT